MLLSFTALILLLCSVGQVGLCGVSVPVRPKNDHKYTKLLRDIFGSHFTPQSADFTHTTTPAAVSKYMNRLFEKYRDRPEFRNSDKIIIRSIMPAKGVVHRSVDFHLDSIGANENVTRARLHVRYRFRRVAGMRSRAPNFGVYQVQEDGTLSNFTPIGSSSHWLIFNLDDAVRFAKKNDRKPISFMLGNVVHGRKRFLSSKRVLKRCIPFLVVHSVEREPKKRSHIYSPPAHLHKLPGAHKFMFPKKGKSWAHKRLRKRSAPRDIGSYFSYSIDNNKDQNAESRLDYENELWKKGPDSILQSRKALKKQERRYLAQSMGTSSPKPWPEYARQIVEYHPYSPENMNPKIILLGSKESPRKQSCNVRKFTVNFKDIGWDHWIIRPNSFDSNLCDGSCSATPGENSAVRQTNHAIIQNIVFNLKQHPEVPMPCCAPDKFDSLTLLYYDENGNVVLKNYPKMSVESCACL